jgi:hypothetical protein
VGILVELGLHNPIAAVIAREGQSEQELGWRLLAKLPPMALVVADRLYGLPSYVGGLLWKCMDLKSQFLVRVRKNLKVRVLEVLSDGSAIVSLRTWDQEGTRLDFLVREIRVRVRRRSGGAEIVRLWTSLLDARKYPAGELAGIYAQRWEVEISLQEFKIQIHGGARLASYTVETACQEIAALLLAQAVVARLRAKAAGGAAIQPLRISFTQTLRYLQGIWMVVGLHPRRFNPRQTQAMIQSAIRALILWATPVRRNRSCPRKVRQPVSSWPRLIRRRESNGPITYEIIKHHKSIP